MADGRAASRNLTSAPRFSATTIDHFQHPRNVGRLADADAVGRVEDATTDTLVEIYVKFDGPRVARATFRTFGCSACIAASSVVTEALLEHERSQLLTAEEIDRLLDGLPADKRYCAELAAEAARRALSASGN